MTLRREPLAAAIGALALLVGLALISGEADPSAPPSGEPARPVAGAPGEPGDAQGGAAARDSAGASDASPRLPRPEPAPLRPGDPSLEGHVVDPSGEPVGAANVRVAFADGVDLDGPATRTNADGAFQLPAPRGQRAHVVKISAAGLAGRLLSVHPGAPVRVILGYGGGVTGTVTGPHDAPLEATVEAVAGDWETRVQTDGSGRFELQGLPPGLASLRVSAPGHLPAIADVAVDLRGAAFVEVALERGQTLSTTLLLPSGSPAAGASVSLRYAAGLEPLRAKADPAGRVQFTGVAPGEATLRATSGAFSLAPTPANLAMGIDTELPPLTLGPNPSVRGRTRDADGAPVVGARVTLAGETARSASDGTFELRVPLGPHLLLVEAEGFVRLKGDVLASQDGGSLELALEPALTLRGVVLDVSEQPVSGATVEAFDGDAQATTTDSSGRFALTGLRSEGPLEVRARAPGHGPIQELVEAPAQASELRLRLGPSRALSGTVRSARGDPLPGASILVEGLSDTIALSDPSGAFELVDLPSAELLVSVVAAGFRPRALTVAPGATSLDVRLSAERLVVGTVRREDGSPVERFAVGPAEAPDRARWFEDGRFVLDLGPETGALVVRAQPPGHHHRGPGEEDPLLSLAPTVVRLGPGTETVTVILAAGHEAEGVVVDAQGNPVEGAAIVRGAAVEEDLYGPMSSDVLGMSEDGGHFHVGSLPAGGLTVTVTHPDHGPLHATITPSDEEATLRLPPQARILGAVQSPDPRGVPLVLVGPCVRRSTAAPDGSFAFGGLSAGDYVLTRVDTDASVRVTVSQGGEARTSLP